MWRGRHVIGENLSSLALTTFSRVTPEEASRKAKYPQRKNIKRKKDS
jgi:hypothetical protein